MGYGERKQIIEKIEKLRGSKFVSYVTTTRPGITVTTDIMMERDDLREIYRHLENSNKKYKKIDLFIYSHGGEAALAWALVNLIREMSEKFDVMVPYSAFSCATSVAIGADNIIMCRTGNLGPIDPLVTNEFNPFERGHFIPIAVEDINGFCLLLKDKLKLSDQQCSTELFKLLFSDVRPLAMGNAYRQYIKARDDARKLLRLHMDPVREKKKIETITETLVEKLYYHGHNITRGEARSIGLDIIDADTIHKGNDNLEDLLWKLYIDYENELKLNQPYKDELPQRNQSKVKLPVKFVESNTFSSVHILEQEWSDFGFPVGSRLSFSNEGQPAIYNPKLKQVIPIFFEDGVPTVMDNKVYVKTESSYWIR
jgi:hypothetical protein